MIVRLGEDNPTLKFKQKKNTLRYLGNQAGRRTRGGKPTVITDIPIRVANLRISLSL